MKINYWQRGDIVLRNLEESDFKLSEQSSPDSYREFMEDYLEMPKSEKDLTLEYNTIYEEYNKDDKKIFVIEKVDTGESVGQVSVWYINKRNRVFKYGIFVNDNFRGLGYAKDALIIVLDFYFNELNYNKVSPMAYSFNKASQKFHEKFGFKLEGIIREETYTRGHFFDMYYYGMTKAEFNSLYKHFDILEN